MRALFSALLVLPLVFMSCAGDQPANNVVDSVPDSAVTVIDSVPADTIPHEVLAFKMGGDTIVPADKNLIFYSFNADLLKKKGKKLSAKDVKQRFYPLDTACDREVIYKMQRFLYLDSLHKKGGYPTDTDMGQMIFGEVMLLDTIKRSPSGTWVVWSLRYESEQACPYSYGTFFMLSTYDAAGKNTSTQCMSREEGGADAPLTWSTVQHSNVFTDGSYRGLLCDSVGDYMDDGSIDYSSIMRKTFTGTISAGGKITTKELEIERNE